MKPEELQNLEAAQKQAMEAINAFNKEAKGLEQSINNILGR